MNKSRSAKAMQPHETRSKAVAIWIGIGVFMLLVQIILGGVTRLTGSGLSITEWNVITGTIPPVREPLWQQEFQKYQQTPQYELINSHFTLKDFKFIYFWEWIHRFWARLIGVVFVIGFVWLLLKKQLKKEMIRPLLTLFLLGALQGTVGWIMVASGLTGDAVYVKPTRLALHFVFALGLTAYAFWFLLELTIPATQRQHSSKIRNLTIAILALVTLQLVFGALMAGHKAALAAPTWPDINGSIIPPTIFKERPLLLNFIENKATIHFVHRTLAYIILLLTIYLASIKVPGFNRIKTIPLSLVIVQVTLGILSLLFSVHIVPNQWGAFEWFAQLHQITALLLVLSLVSILYLVRRN